MVPKFLRIALMVVVIGFFRSSSIVAQQDPTNRQQVNESASKSCVVVFGAVRAPGRFELRRNIQLHEVLALAGGLTTRADGKIQVIKTGSACFQEALRNGGTPPTAQSPKDIVLNVAEVMRLDKKADPYIDPGDVVIVVESEPIYVLGNVFKPQVLYAKQPLTLTRAIAMAGGVTNTRKDIKVVIFSLDTAGRYAEYLKVDLSEIKHSARDPILHPYDIVSVGPSGLLIPPMNNPMFDPRPLIPLPYRIHRSNEALRILQ